LRQLSRCRERKGEPAAGLKVRRQCPIGPFIADLNCAEHRLVSEVDGGVHNAQAEADEQRSQRLTNYGYRVLRVRKEEAESDLPGVLARILATCQASG
jgi:very-short-patch-repair endonuclease